jgi:hypothetical protein
MSNPYWRGMVKDAIGCDDNYADILLEYQYKVSNGPDFSEANEGELDKYWKSIHLMYQEDKDIMDTRTNGQMLEAILDITLELQDVTDQRFNYMIDDQNKVVLDEFAVRQIVNSIKTMKAGV